jgi:G3E family GTPase
MSKVNKVRELVTKSQQLQDDSTRMYRLFQEDLKREQASIKNNEEYSAKGKQKLVDSLKSRKTIEFLKGSREMQTSYRNYLKDAKKEAESIVYAKTPQVDSDKLDRFKNRFKEVKTEILLAPSSRRGKEILQEFLGSVDEQGLAVVVKEEFGDIIQPILAGAGTDAPKFRHDLAKSFEELKTRSLDPEAVEAMRLAEYADQALNAKFYSPLVEDNVQQNLGKLAHMYMHNPDEYFETFPDDEKHQSQLRTVEEILEEEEAKTL